MRYYAGMDVSLEETAICIVDQTGKVIRQLRVTSEPDALTERVSRSASAA
jgi:transposase